MARNISRRVYAALTAQNTFGSACSVANGRLNVWVGGTFSATVWLQRRAFGESSWRDVESYTALAVKVVEVVGSWEYRLGIKTSGFTSGTAECELVPEH